MRKVLTGEKAASTIEYISLAAVILALIATLYTVVDGPGATRIGETTSEAIRTMVTSVGSRGVGDGPLVGGEQRPEGPTLETVGADLPAVLRPVIGIWEFLGRVWRGIRWFDGSPSTADRNAPAPATSQGEASQDETGPELDDGAAPQSRFGELLEEESSGKASPDEDKNTELHHDQDDAAQQTELGELLEEAEKQAPEVEKLSGVPVLHQKSVTTESLRSEMRANVNHYREFGCLPTSVSAVTQYFASQGKGQALSPSEVMSLFYDNQMWSSRDGSSASDEQLEAVLSGHGFEGKTHYGQTDQDAALREVKGILRRGTPVIALLGTHPLGQHAVVITGFKDGMVFYNDPYTGQAHSVDEKTFTHWWVYALGGENKFPYIVIEPK